MLSKKLLFSILLINFALLLSCDQRDNNNKVEPAIGVESTTKVEKPIKSKYTTIHSYGGWSCPDNLRGFPPVDIPKLAKVPVVEGRLPTKEEASNGSSLMYFDTEEIPSARPLEMTLPKLARYYSEYTKKNELVIVIQAVVAETDTVVGFRYLNGGNGSAWLGEVSFLSEEEIDKLGSTPFVFFNLRLSASKAKIWEVITNPANAKQLGEVYGEGTYIESDWTNNSKVYLKDESDNIVSTGTITSLWENMYIQVDYNIDGFHYVEKLLILENEDNYSRQLYLVSGPYAGDFEVKKTAWIDWLHKVKELSEGEGC